MKRHLITITAAFAALLSLSSCGGSSKDVSIRNVEIYGDIYYENKDTGESETYDAEEYMDIPDGTYKFHISNDMLSVTVNAKIIKDFPEPYATSVSAEDFELQIYDSQGNPIKNAEGDDIYMELVNIDNLAQMLNWSNVGDYFELNFRYALLGESGILEQIEGFDISFDIYAFYSEYKDDEDTSATDSDDETQDLYDQVQEEYDNIKDEMKNELDKALKEDPEAAEALETSKEILELFL